MREGMPRWKKRRAPANRATAQALSHPHHKGVGGAGRKRERSVSERGVFGEVGGSASKEAAVVVMCFWGGRTLACKPGGEHSPACGSRGDCRRLAGVDAGCCRRAGAS